MINLLPPLAKGKLHQNLLTRQLNHLGFILAIIFLGGAVFIFNTFIFLKIQTSSLKQTLNVETINADTQKVQDLEGETKNLNNLLLKNQGFRQGSQSSLEIFREIEKVIPAGAKLAAFSWEDVTEKIVLSGRAQTRDDVLAMEKRLKDSLVFEKIESPLANFLEKNNVSFNFVFYFKPRP
ncbi:MAG: PilN domain-containing protein [Patescibacteria group bacterium]